MALLEDKKIILGSSSPRRHELLSKIGIKFEVITPNCDETLDSTLDLEDAIIDVSKRKAMSIKDGDIVITADTLVVFDDKVLGKPINRENAFDILKMLSGQTHYVLTAVTIKNGEEYKSFCTKTRIKFYKLSNDEINAYLDTDEAYDKAGAYGIQGLGGLFVEEICGDYYSVVGLPISKIYRLIGDL